MPKIFEIHPLPWQYKHRSLGFTTQGEVGKIYLADANGKELNLSDSNVIDGLKQMSEWLPKGKKRRLGGNFSNKVYMVKDNTNGTYHGPQCSRTRQYRCHVQARRSARQCNKNCNSLTRYTVVEVTVTEKVAT